MSCWATTQTSEWCVRAQTETLRGHPHHRRRATCVCRFDQRYLHGRSLVCVDDDSGESLVNLGELGRCEEGGGMLRERELNSGAYGQNKFCTLTTPGILQLDLLQHMR